MPDTLFEWAVVTIGAYCAFPFLILAGAIVLCIVGALLDPNFWRS